MYVTYCNALLRDNKVDTFQSYRSLRQLSDSSERKEINTENINTFIIKHNNMNHASAKHKLNE